MPGGLAAAVPAVDPEPGCGCMVMRQITLLLKILRSAVHRERWFLDDEVNPHSWSEFSGYRTFRQGNG
jgi:hypothetical protein